MGDYISLSEGLIIAVVSIIAVFVVLILIAFLISGLKAFSGDKKDKVQDKPKELEQTEEVALAEDPDIITEELVAVIATAIATNLGINIRDLNIKRIRRVPQLASNWTNTGNIKQTSGRL